MAMKACPRHISCVLILLLAGRGALAFLSAPCPLHPSSSSPLVAATHSHLRAPHSFIRGSQKHRAWGLTSPVRETRLTMGIGRLEGFDHEGVKFLRLCDPSSRPTCSDSSVATENASAHHTPSLALFRIGRVLLPGSSFPLQIFKHKTTTQEMLRKEAAENKGRIGVVFSDTDHKGSFATVGCEAVIESLTQLDDGRLIVECTGTRRFRVGEVCQQEPYLRAEVEYMEDLEQGGESCEVECWKMLQELVWLCVEVWDKRSWVSLLMSGGEGHPLHKFKHSAPSPSGDGKSLLVENGFATDQERRESFSWHMVRVIRNGIPGLWDHDMTGTTSSPSKVQQLLETTSCEERLRECLATMTSARDVLRLRQRLKDFVDEREVSEQTTEDGVDEEGGEGRDGDRGA